MNAKPTGTPLQHLDGQLLAMQYAVRSLIELQPDPKAAWARVAVALEEAIARALASSDATDALVMGMESAKKALLPKRPGPRIRRDAG